MITQQQANERWRKKRKISFTMLYTTEEEHLIIKKTAKLFNQTITRFCVNAIMNKCNDAIIKGVRDAEG